MKKILKRTVFIFLLAGTQVLSATAGTQTGVHKAAFVMEPTPADTVMQVGGNAGTDLASSRYAEGKGQPVGAASNAWGDEEMDLIILKKKVEQQAQNPAAYPFPVGKNTLTGQGQFAPSATQVQKQEIEAGKMTATSQEIPLKSSVSQTDQAQITSQKQTTKTETKQDPQKKGLTLVNQSTYTKGTSVKSVENSVNPIDGMQVTSQTFPLAKSGLNKETQEMSLEKSVRGTSEEQLGTGALLEGTNVVVDGLEASKGQPEKSSIARVESAEIGVIPEEAMPMAEKSDVDKGLDIAMEGPENPSVKESGNQVVGTKPGVALAQTANVGRVGEPALTLASAGEMPLGTRSVDVVTEETKKVTSAGSQKAGATQASLNSAEKKTLTEGGQTATFTKTTLSGTEGMQDQQETGILGQVKEETARALTTEAAAKKAPGIREDALSVSQKEDDLEKGVQGVIIVENPLAEGEDAEGTSVAEVAEVEPGMTSVDTQLVCPSARSSGTQTKVYASEEEVILAAKQGDKEEKVLKIPADCALEKKADSATSSQKTEAPGTIAVDTHLVCPAAQVEGSSIRIYPARADVVMAARQGKLSERTQEIPVGCTLKEGPGKVTDQGQKAIAAATSSESATAGDTAVVTVSEAEKPVVEEKETKVAKTSSGSKKDPITLIPAKEDPILAGVPQANTKSSGAFADAHPKESALGGQTLLTSTPDASLGMQRLRLGESIQDWEARPGDTLRELLTRWGEQAGWTVIWSLERDYHLEAGVVFRGRFVDVAGAIVRVFARATPAPIGTFYQGNRVLVINAQEEENGY